MNPSEGVRIQPTWFDGAVAPVAGFGLCATIWGSTFLAIRVGNDSLAPVWACTLRLIIGSVILSLILLTTRQALPTGAALRASLWYGFFEFGIGLPLLYWGEKVVPSGLAALLYALSPIMTMVSARLLGIERLSLPKLLAAASAFFGVAIIFWREVLQGMSASGFVAITLATLVGAVGVLMLERGPKQSAIGANAVGALVGAACSLVASFVLGEAHGTPATLRAVFPVLYLAVMSTVVAFVTLAWLVSRWRTTTVSFLGVVVPIIALALGASLRNEKLAPGAPIGAAIVIVSVAIALYSEAKNKKPEASLG